MTELTRAQSNVLHALAKRRHFRFQAISVIVGLRPRSVVTILGKLRARGLADKSDDFWRITPAGRLALQDKNDG